MGSFQGARTPTGNTDIPTYAIDDQIYSIFGQELVVLQRNPADGRSRIAVKVEVGTFRMGVGVGDTDDDLAAPTETDVTAGGQTIQLKITDGIMVFSRNTHMKFQGEAGSDILTFWLLP